MYVLGLLGPNLFDATFFLPHLRKVVDFMREGSQHPIASSLAQKARILLEKLMDQVEQLDNNESRLSPKRHCYKSDSHSGKKLEIRSDADLLKHKVRLSGNVSFFKENDDRDMTKVALF